MISLKFKVGSAVDISLAISGKSCCKDAALSAATDAGSGYPPSEIELSATDFAFTSSGRGRGNLP